jgi:hypothetical protein
MLRTRIITGGAGPNGSRISAGKTRSIGGTETTGDSMAEIARSTGTGVTNIINPRFRGSQGQRDGDY